MKSTLPRALLPSLVQALSETPAVALLGPRQCGKTTLSLQLKETIPDILHLDLERPADLAKLDDPEFFLSRQKGRLVCIDGSGRGREAHFTTRTVPAALAS
ncbi:MAG: AAA family ATPase [Kiritimatiellae bacterium]|nr:AAA family ATPase [Kiritimatiellia bacterium]